MTDYIKSHLTDDELDTLNNMRNLGSALKAYRGMVEYVAENNDDNTTIEMLRAGQPDLDFMDDEEIEDMLGAGASQILCKLQIVEQKRAKL